jgi:signal transduction histidine kinase
MSATQTQNSAETACAQTRERVEQIFAEQRLAISPQTRSEARELAVETFAGFRSVDEGAHAAGLKFAGELFGARAGELAGRPQSVAMLTERLHRALGVSREALARELLSLPAGSSPSPAEAVRTTLGLLVGLLPVSGAALWQRDRAGLLRRVDDAGTGTRSPAARALAQRLLDGECAHVGPRAELFGLGVRERGEVVGALVVRGEPRERGVALAGLRVVLAAVADAIARDTLMTRNASDERALLESGERRLVRLGFDLHDGPLQELLALAEDLRLFREQLVGVLGGRREQELLRGRLDDLDARLVALEDGLRRISTSLHASGLTDRPFAQALAEVIDAFAARSSVVPRLRLRGDADAMSASQRIALLSVVGEALNNIREHGGAVSEVRIEIDFGAEGVSARVLDDGRGFDVEAALLSAARRGRMGLAGIHERVRLLGGRCVVDSRPGGPTAISLSMPRWKPLAPGAPAAAAR